MRGIRIDLSDPKCLCSTLKSYLSLSVCPAVGIESPGMLKVVSVTLALPGGQEVVCQAQVVAESPGGRFLLHIQDRLDLERLAFLAEMSTRTTKAMIGAGGHDGVPCEPLNADTPFATVEDPAPHQVRRQRLPARHAARPTPGVAQPPPKLGRRGDK